MFYVVRYHIVVWKGRGRDRYPLYKVQYHMVTNPPTVTKSLDEAERFPGMAAALAAAEQAVVILKDELGVTSVSVVPAADTVRLMEDMRR